jgi:hypothetical protein
VVHLSCSDPGGLRIKVSSDRVEIWQSQLEVFLLALPTMKSIALKIINNFLSKNLAKTYQSIKTINPISLEIRIGMFGFSIAQW